MTRILQVAIPIPVRQVFDYLPPTDEPRLIRPGIRVLVPFGRQTRVGYLLAIVANPESETAGLKPIARVLDESPLLSPADLKLLTWAASYYHHPLGEVWASAFPGLLRQGRAAAFPTEPRWVPTDSGVSLQAAQIKRAPRQTELLERLRRSPEGLAEAELANLFPNWRSTARQLLRKGLATVIDGPPRASETAARVPETCPFALNDAQQNAIAAVAASLDHYQSFLLQGVTGSGKTEVYLQLTRIALDRGNQVLLLLPEISLTPQLETRFRSRFATSIAVFHSRLTENERLSSWLRIQSGEAGILLGTRSAVFIPMKRLGLVIIDEEHDSSFKQQEGFRFSARDVAIRKAQYLRIPVLLGSATPSLESLANVARSRYRPLPLPDRAGGAVAPKFRMIDIRNQRLREGLSRTLLGSIQTTLQQGEQVLLFLNRRGYAPTLICHACGWVARCPRCDARLVVHLREAALRCHYCGHQGDLPDKCPECHKRDLRPLGIGTQRLETILAELFPDQRLVRIDRDSTQRAGSLEKKLEQARSGEADILLGTQMLAKGHHFPRVTLVAILDVDAMLFATDFRASERTSQLIVQVAGRAGRAERPGTVMLQTRHPDHPLLRTLIERGYPGFAEAALAERRLAGLPPAAYLTILRADALDPDSPRLFLEELARLTTELGGTAGMLILGPAPAPMLRQAGRFRYQLALQSTDRKTLHTLVEGLLQSIPGLAAAKKIRWSVDIDPIDCY